MTDNKRAIVVATVACFLGFEINDIKILESLGYTVYVATNFDTYEYMHDTLREAGVSDRHQLQVDFTRSPFTTKVPEAYFELVKILDKGHFTLMHCHTPVGGVIGRLAAKHYNACHRGRGSLTNSDGQEEQHPLKVIYTAHGFHFYDGAPKKNWLIYYPIERHMSRYTDVLITINHEDYHRAKNEFHAKKTVYVPGVGVDTAKFATVPVDRDDKRKSLGVALDDIMLLSVGELNENKNHQVVIRALADIVSKSPVPDDTHIRYFIAGQGPMKDELQQLIKELGLQDKVTLLGYRDDVAELLKAADIYILPSLREGLNVSLMEAMSAGKPCIASDIRGNRDCIVPGKGGELFEPQSVESCRYAIEAMCQKDLSPMTQYNKRKIRAFDLSVVEKNYENLIRGGV